MASALFDLSGRTALVTGASRGLGSAMAEGMAQAGATLVLNGSNALAPRRPACGRKAIWCTKVAST